MKISSDINNLKKIGIKEPKIKGKQNYLTDIKSFFNLDEIFSFFNIKLKLNIIIYNKELQKRLGIDIEDYKKINGKNIIGDVNGKVKEYDYYNGKLIFEGEYLNGKRNGKGKEYYNNGKLIFEGEYLNGKRNGKGKEYNYNGNLIFESEYLNGERNGKGKEYNNNELIFEGEFLNGQKWNGQGKEYNNDELIFEGEYLLAKNGMEKEKNMLIIDWNMKVNI